MPSASEILYSDFMMRSLVAHLVISFVTGTSFGDTLNASSFIGNDTNGLTLNGGNGEDVIVGTSLDDVIDGGNNDDVITAGGGG